MSSDQAIVQKLIDEFYDNELSNPNSPNYLPKLIQSAGFDPYTPGTDWNVGQLQGVGGGDGAAAVCNVAVDSDNFGLPAEGDRQYPSLKLPNPTISGLSNVSAKRPIAGGPDGRTITLSLSFPMPSRAEDPMDFHGDFQLDQYCCQSKKPYGAPGAACIAGTTKEFQGSGTFEMKISESSSTATLRITKLDNDVLELALDAITFVAEADDVSITADITSIPEDQRSTWNNYANGALGQSSVHESIVAQIQATLQEDGARNQIASVIQKRLVEYLKANNLYPFGDGGFEALF